MLLRTLRRLSQTVILGLMAGGMDLCLSFSVAWGVPKRFSLEKWLEFELEKKYPWCIRDKMTREEGIEATGFRTMVVLT